MKKTTLSLIVVGVIALGVLFWLFAPPSVGNPELASDADSIARGAYSYNAAGCGSCHEPEGSDAPVGGYTIEQQMTVAGITMDLVFHAPNITPDPETGIGGWTGKDFLRAVKHGRSPGGGFYWPAFPFRSYRFMTDQDVLDIGAYLMSLEPVRQESVEHEVPWYLPRITMAGWNKLAPMMEGTPAPVGDDPQVQRGAYLARAMGHCGECHTPRNSMGMMQYDQEFAGSEGVAPAIDSNGLRAYGHEDFVALLTDGMTINFESVGGEMADVIGHTSKLIPEDREAYASFFLREE
ncbi:MAG: c-type cytochrome [Gammaproteobacteria bacterium]